MSTFSNQLFNIPTMPREKIALPDGSLHPTWNNYFSQLTVSLTKMLSAEGMTMPSVTNAQLAVLNNTTSTARFIYNSDTNQMMVNNNGVYANIQTF